MPAASWPSPITTTDVARAGVRVSWPSVLGRRVWWTEDRPDEGGRTTIVHRAADGTHRELLPAPWNARTRVHEYGGRPYAVTPGGDVVFANSADQRLYLRERTGEMTPLTPAGQDTRYADPLVHDNRIWCVREHHLGDGDGDGGDGDGGDKVTRAIVSIPLDGGPELQHVTGDRFYAFPTLSPDGRHLAYIAWNHPQMPWDGTELHVSRLSDGLSWRVRGGPSESILAPQWKDDERLYLISDSSGWWNLHEVGLRGEAPRPLCPLAEEFAWPLWNLGGAPYTILADGRLAVLHGRHGDLRLGVLDPSTGVLADLDVPFDGWVPALATDGTSVVGVAYGAKTPKSVVRVDTTTSTLTGATPPNTAPSDSILTGGTATGSATGTAPDTAPDTATSTLTGGTAPDTATGSAIGTAAGTAAGTAEVLASDLEQVPDAAYLPTPRAVVVPGDDGSGVPAFLYPPANPPATPEGPPPYVVFVHGGPTASADTALDLEKAFLTSRGIGVLDVNYGGSTGYGRAYRERLKGQWGLLDVADTIAAARWLAAEGLADPDRIAVRGRSAGGWTVMAACCRSGVFAGGVSYYGVSALAPLNAHTHDFESRYVAWLVGPENPLLYAEREPLALVSGVSCPMLLLQGLDDPVVPPEQSSAFADALAERGIPCTYLAFEGESHGFRRPETRSAALAAEYAFYQQIFL